MLIQVGKPSKNGAYKRWIYWNNFVFEAYGSDNNDWNLSSEGLEKLVDWMWFSFSCTGFQGQFVSALEIDGKIAWK